MEKKRARVRRSRYQGVRGLDCKATKRRVVLRSGVCNISIESASMLRMRLLQDIFTTMVDLPWRWTLFVVTMIFFMSWLVFGVIWWLIALAHGDLEPDHLPPFQEEIGWTPCVTHIYNFTSCFLFSMENQHTTGFGARMPTEECPEAIFLMCMQAIVGVIIQTALLGIVFAKVVRPKQRTRTILFSRSAVICRRDGALCLMFRVADMRTRSHIIESKMHVLLVGERTTPEGERLVPHRTELKLEGGDRRFFLLWPETVVHCIDGLSPLWGMSAADMALSRLEVVAVLEGTVESTDQRVQARASYLLPEVQWGHRFEPAMRFSNDTRCYRMDYRCLDSTVSVPTPLCSARDQSTLTPEEFIEHMSQQSDSADGSTIIEVKTAVIG